MAEIPGLTLIHDFISADEEKKLLEYIYAQNWSHYLNRRVQHYGYVYNYKTRDVTRNAPPIPSWLNSIMEKNGRAKFDRGISKSSDYK